MNGWAFPTLGIFFWLQLAAPVCRNYTFGPVPPPKPVRRNFCRPRNKPASQDTAIPSSTNFHRPRSDLCLHKLWLTGIFPRPP